MHKETIVTPTSIVEVTTAVTNGTVEPHTLIKEYVAEKFQTNEFDRVFDNVYQIGLDLGTDKYDEAMSITLKALEIPEEEILTMLRSKGVAI